MKQADIDRINELARKAKTEGLTDAEKAEQSTLRAAYIASVKQSLTSQLDRTYFVEADGTQHKLRKKK